MKNYPNDWNKVVDRFADALKSRLAANVHKGDWRDVSIKTLLEKLSEESSELVDAVGLDNAMEVLLEAADVAVCAMMIADIYMGSPRPSLIPENE